MATEIEEMRQKAEATTKERDEFLASFGDDKLPTEEDERKLEAMENGLADLQASIARYDKFAEASASRPVASGARANPARSETKGRIATLGQRFVMSQEFESALKAVGSSILAEKSKFPMDPVKFNGLGDLYDLRSNLITGESSTSAGAFVEADRQPGAIMLGRRPLRIRDVIQVLQTSSDLVEFVRQTSRTNNAAIVAEATAAGDGSGVKPESDMAFEVASAPVVTVANWTPVTRRAVQDVPQMRGIIDSELRDNLDETLEDQVVNGSGTMVGMLQTSGRQTQAWSTNILTTTRKAKTIVGTVARRVPTAYLLNPGDWETIDLLQDNEARYFYGGPSQVGVPRLWGLPVVETEAVAEGIGITGAFSFCTLWDREQGTLSVSDSHQDFFTRNLLAVLAELRAAFAVRQPNAIVEIDLTA